MKNCYSYICYYFKYYTCKPIISLDEDEDNDTDTDDLSYIVR